MLRKKGVVGKFVEFYGAGLDDLPLADRATIANMAPEYGATCGFFPIDDETLDYLRAHRPRRRARSRWSRPMPRRRACGATPTTPDPVFTDTLELDLADGRAVAGRAEAAAGPRAARRHAEAELRRRAWTRSSRKADELGKRVTVEGAQLRPRPRRGRHRRDHLLHQHLQPDRDDRRRPARAQGGRERASRPSRGSRPRSRRARRSSPTTRQGRACRPTSTRSASTSSATAAPPASATPGRCPTRSSEGDQRQRPRRRRRCSPATATSRAASTRTCGRTTSPRRRWSSPMRSPARCTIDLTNEPLGTGSDGKPVYLKDIWPTQRRRSPTLDRRARSRASCSRRATPTSSRATRTGRRSTVDRRHHLRVGRRARPTSQNPPYFDGHDAGAGAGRPTSSGARVLGLLRRLDHHRPHLARPASIKATARPAQYLHRAQRRAGGLQPLRRAARQPRGDDARHLRQHPHQERDGAAGTSRAASRIHQPDRRADVDLRRRDALQGARACRWSSSPARNTAPAPRATGRPRARNLLGVTRRDRRELRAHPPLEPGRHGRAAARVRGGHDAGRRSASTATRPSTIRGIAERPQAAPGARRSRSLAADGSAQSRVRCICRIDTLDELEYFRNGGILHYVLRQLAA